jgi:signal transduction histidine kinase
MTDLRLYLQGDQHTAERLREVLAREGFCLADGTAAQPGIAVEVEPGDGAREMARRVEELERTVLELRNLDVAKSQFLTNVSHELRTPLTAIVTYGEVLRDGLLGEILPRQREAIESVIGSSRQLLSMIEEILTYARTNAPSITLRPVEFRLKDVVATYRR